MDKKIHQNDRERMVTVMRKGGRCKIPKSQLTEEERKRIGKAAESLMVRLLQIKA